MKNLLLVCFALFIISCEEKEGWYRDTKVSNIELKDVGRIKYEFAFEAKMINDTTTVMIRTNGIQRNDSIGTLDATVKGASINLFVYSSPHDFDCREDTCFTVHDLTFCLPDIKSGKYEIRMILNGEMLNFSDYYIK